MRLIDSEALLVAMSDKYEELRKRDDNTLSSDFTHISFLIEQAPTIDPVRHAKWMDIDDEGVCFMRMCSDCKAVTRSCNADVGCNWDALYCPNCGAQMNSDGGEESAAD